MKKKGQMQISFGMIFSIIIIIAIVAVAIYAITAFLDFGKCVNTGLLKDDLQVSIDNAWASGRYEKTLELNPPSGMEFICFIDTSQDGRGEYEDLYEEFERYWEEDATMFFYPFDKVCGGGESYILEHVNITATTENGNMNPICM